MNQTEDVLVDTRGNIYISDKNWGVFILRYTGLASRRRRPGEAAAKRRRLLQDLSL